jgi:hypothetical protein
VEHLVSELARKIPPWWTARDSEVGDALYKTFEHIEQMPQETRRRADIHFHMALYGDDEARRSMIGLDRERRADKLTFNLVKAVIDTAQAEVAQLSPKPTMLTSRGDWGTRQRAKAMELTIEGDYDRCDVYAQAAEGFLDASKAGDGWLKVYGSGGEVQIERVAPGEILVDPVEGQYGRPQTLYQAKPMCRDVVLDEFGDDDKATRDAIMRAPLLSHKLFPWLPRDTTTHPILVIEGWRLPVLGPDGEVRSKGRHVIAVKGGVLLDEEWDRSCFPFARFSWGRPSIGYHGQALAQELRSIQRELNYTLIKIQDCIHRASTVRYLIEGNSRVQVEHIGNTPGEILRFFGAIPPQVQVVDGVPASLLQHAEDLIRRGFEQTGVSLLSAMSRKPAGLNSGEAQRVNQDIESKRFIIKSKAYERWIGVELAKLVIQERRALHEAGHLKKTRAEVRRGRKVFIRHIDWSEAAMDAEDFKIRVFPTSLLPSQPAGRVAAVEQWFSAGLIDRDQMLRLIDFPDLDDFRASELAPYDLVLDHLDRMIEDGEYTFPSPIQDLGLSKRLALLAYQRYSYEGVPEDRTELVLRYYDDILFLEEQAMAAAQPMDPMAAGQMSPEAGGEMAGMADMMSMPPAGSA